MLHASGHGAAVGTRLRRAPVTLVLLGLCMVFVPAAGPAQPLEADLLVREVPPPGPQMTPYLRAQVDRAWAHDATRQARLDAVTSEADLLALQREIRGVMLDAIGDLPESRTPLNARVVGSEQFERYRIERVVFESVPGLHVTAVVYVPGGPADPQLSGDTAVRRHPAVLFAAGHATIGKAYEGYQQIAARLATLGYVVIAWDPIGQGERSQFWDVAKGDTRYDRVCGEHAVLGNLATLAGASISRWMVWDGIRALDYLLTRADVDAGRIAITGASGGGYQSAWIGALDSRIAVVAPAAFISALPMRMANRIFEDPDSDPEQDPPGLVSAGVDHVGLLLAAYPRRIHISGVTRDFFPIEGTRLTFRRVRDVYARFGHGDRVVMSEVYARHSYAEASQLSAFRFMARAFSLPVPDALPDVETLPAERLQVTPTGQVRVDLPGRSVTDVIRDYYDTHRARRTVDVAALYARALDTVAAEGPPRIEPDAGQRGPNLVTWTRTGSATWQDVTIDRYLLRHDGLQEIPLLHIRRRQPGARTVLHVDLRGKVTPARWDEVSAHVRAGADVISFDLPGAGETRMPYHVVTHPYIEATTDEVRHDHPLSSVMGNHVYNGLLTGRPYLVDALRAVDVVRTFATNHLGASSLAVTGPGTSATLAATAAAVLPGVSLEVAPDAQAFDWSEAVTTSRELWPIQYLVSGGAYITLTPGSAAGSASVP